MSVTELRANHADVATMTKSVRSLSKMLPEGYELVGTSVRGSCLFGMETETSDVDVAFMFRRPLGKALLEKPPVLRFMLPGVKDEVVGHDVYEVLGRLAAGDSSYLHYVVNLPLSMNAKCSFFGRKPSETYQEWLYCSNGWDTLFFSEEKQMMFLTKHLVQKSQKKAKSLFMSWANHMERSWVSKEHVQALTKDNPLSSQFYYYQKVVQYALRELGWLLHLLLVNKRGYPAGTKKAYQMFLKNGETEAFHDNLKAILSGEMTGAPVRSLYEKLSASLNAMAEDLPETVDQSKMQEVATRMSGFDRLD